MGGNYKIELPFNLKEEHNNIYTAPDVTQDLLWLSTKRSDEVNVRARSIENSEQTFTRNNMKKIKLLTAPYKFYNQFMPPLALCIISQHLLDNNIEHDMDDLYVRLYHYQKNGHISLDIKDSDIPKWNAYINGEDNDDVEKIVSKIASLTKFEGYNVLLFSAGPPAGGDIPEHILPLALFRFLKKKYNPIIISNNPQLGGKGLGLVDEIFRGSNELFKYLRENLHLNIDPNLKIGTKQNLDGLQLDLYRNQNRIVVGYYFYDGCPYNCFFCDGFFTQKKKNKQRNLELPGPQEVVAEIKDFVDKYGITNFMFHNTNINVTEKFAQDIANNIIKSELDIMWCDCATFKGMNYELLDLLKKSGCVKLVFGLETASKRLQKRINKTVDLEHAEKIIKYCYDIGIWVDITLLCGLPHETYQDIYKTLLFIKKNYKYLRGINLNRFMIKSGSDFYHNSKKHGLVIKQVNEEYTPLGFDENNGMKWEEKWRYTEKVYNEIINALDPARVDFTRPVNHIFRVFSNKVPIPIINRHIDQNILNNDTSKLDLLMQKYKNLIPHNKIEILSS